MSLTIVARKGTKLLYVRGTVRGARVFESTGTADKEKAEDYRIKREGEIWNRRLHGRRATATFAELVTSYLEFEERSDATKAYVIKLLEHFRATPLDEIDQTAVDIACRKILSKKATAATKIRAIYTPLSAMLKHGAIRKMCALPMFEKPTVKQVRMVFLLPAEVNALIDSAAPHLRPLFTFLAGTGARMSEALELKWSDVDLHGARAIVHQKQGNDRHIDLCPRVIAALAALPNKEGTVFLTQEVRNAKGRVVRQPAPYGKTRVRGGQIKTGWKAACRRAGLPGITRKVGTRTVFEPHATPHSLRHTWASGYYCVNKDILKLKNAGGWSTISMCERYAHMMPDIYANDWRSWYAGGPINIERKTA